MLTKAEVKNLIVVKVAALGSPMPVGFFDKMCYIESRYNPGAVSSTGCKGLFQFSQMTWKQFGVGDRLDPSANTEAAIRLANANFALLKKGLKRDPLPGEVYMAHNIGAGGALRLLKADPHVQVSKALIGSKPEYNPKYLMSGKTPVTAAIAINRYIADFKGV